jgi:hypothetical protein
MLARFISQRATHASTHRNCRRTRPRARTRSFARTPRSPTSLSPRPFPRAARSPQPAVREAFVRDLNPEAPTFPPTLGELTKRLKAWRNKLQARCHLSRRGRGQARRFGCPSPSSILCRSSVRRALKITLPPKPQPPPKPHPLPQPPPPDGPGGPPAQHAAAGGRVQGAAGGRRSGAGRGCFSTAGRGCSRGAKPGPSRPTPRGGWPPGPHGPGPTAQAWAGRRRAWAALTAPSVLSSPPAADLTVRLPLFLPPPLRSCRCTRSRCRGSTWRVRTPRGAAVSFLFWRTPWRGGGPLTGSHPCREPSVGPIPFPIHRA